MKIYHPREGDVLPIPLEFQNYNPDWVWIMGNAILIAAPAHDIVLLLRLIRFGEDMPPMWMHRLFQHVLKEVKERGYKRFMTWLATDIRDEQKLHRIAEQAGAFFEPWKGDIVIGAL